MCPCFCPSCLLAHHHNWDIIKIGNSTGNTTKTSLTKSIRRAPNSQFKTFLQFLISLAHVDQLRCWCILKSRLKDCLCFLFPRLQYLEHRDGESWERYGEWTEHFTMLDASIPIPPTPSSGVWRSLEVEISLCSTPLPCEAMIKRPWWWKLGDRPIGDRGWCENELWDIFCQERRCNRQLWSSLLRSWWIKN
jgi:hypothetical protein